MFRLIALASLAISIAAGATPTLANTATFGNQTDLGVIQQPELDEISGVVASVINPDVFWAHNDRINTNHIYAFNRQGQDLVDFELPQTINRDWEAIGIGPGPVDGVSYLYIGDIGDNQLIFGTKHIYRLPEPIVSSSQSPVDARVFGVERISYVYPDALRNGEGMFVDPLTKDIYIATKAQTEAFLYRAPYPQSTTSTITLELVGELPLTRVSSADITRSGEEILIKTHDSLYLWCRSPGEDVGDILTNNAPTVVPYVQEPDGDAVAWDRQGLGYYTASEELGGVAARLFFYPRTDFVYANTDGLCITAATNCVSVPIELNREDTTDVLAASITIQLPPELQLCGNQFVQGSWLDGFTSTFLTTDNGGGSYTIDQAILGPPCGVSTGGTMFTVDVTGPADAIAAISITSVVMRDCTNAPLPGLPGPTQYLPIDTTPPAAIADLIAMSRQTGNDSDGTTTIDVAFTPVSGDARLVEVYRSNFGDYPEYDDGTGSQPAVPANPGDPGWTLLASLTPPFADFTDEPSGRDYYYYTAFIYDACGHVSAASNFGETVNYHLGDVSDGVSPGTGDNQVSTVDISALGVIYGTSINFGDPRNYLDIGPTSAGGMTGRPLTDDLIDFEDLILLAINFGQVGKGAPAPPRADRNRIAAVVPTLPPVGSVFDVPIRLEADGSVQGLSVGLGWDTRVVEWAGWRPGSLVDSQARTTTVLSPRPGVVDAAILGDMGPGLSGDGTFAIASFRVRRGGDPTIGFEHVLGRDATNLAVDIEGAVDATTVRTSVLPTAMRLHPPSPNPFNPRTTIRFELAQRSRARVAVYAANGRLVRVLRNEVFESGEHQLVWDGTDGGGARVASGTYLLRLETADFEQTRKLTLLK